MFLPWQNACYILGRLIVGLNPCKPTVLTHFLVKNTDLDIIFQLKIRFVRAS